MAPLQMEETFDSPQTTASWINIRETTGTCTPTSDGYTITAPYERHFNLCMADQTNLNNEVSEADVTLLSGDCAAIVTHAQISKGQFYFFRVCYDGSYRILRYDHFETNGTVLRSRLSDHINKGYNKNNRIAVVVNNYNFSLSINGQFITSVFDDTYPPGQIGLAADNDDQATEACFTHLRVWY